MSITLLVSLLVLNSVPTDMIIDNGIPTPRAIILLYSFKTEDINISISKHLLYWINVIIYPVSETLTEIIRAATSKIHIHKLKTVLTTD